MLALTGLRAFAVPLIWKWLQSPPPTGLPDIDASTWALSSTWIATDFVPALWTHFDYIGPLIH